MKIDRVWEMPTGNTFELHCVKRLVSRHIGGFSIDPFANRSRIATVTNDLDPEMGCDHCMDALDFIGMFGHQSVDFVFFDPPYSPRQVSECYKRLGKTVNMETTQSSFWGDLRDAIARVVKPGGTVMSFGWNSCGIGATRGFEIVEILLVAHGGQHNDTICTVERKIVSTLF